GSSPVPRQLPPASPMFAGRPRELATLDTNLNRTSRRHASATIIVITGVGGIGKTSLTLHWARQIAGRYPDGQLYLNLRGFDPSGPPTAPMTALRTFLDALGVA